MRIMFLLLSTPAVTSISLGAAFSYVGFSSQTSDEDIFVTPSKAKKRKYVKKLGYNFKKGQPDRATKTVELTRLERVPIQRPTSALFSDIHIPTEDKTFDLMLSSEGKVILKNWYHQQVIRK